MNVTIQNSENKALEATDGILPSTTSDDHPLIDVRQSFLKNSFPKVWVPAQDVFLSHSVKTFLLLSLGKLSFLVQNSDVLRNANVVTASKFNFTGLAFFAFGHSLVKTALKSLRLCLISVKARGF